jgi:tocopherol O-methyltransferase
MILAGAEVARESVAAHYDELDLAYRRIWGEHVHHGYWATGRESPAEAAEALTRLVADRLAPRAGERLLDIGCGYGATGRWLAAHRGVDVLGFTLSTKQAEIGAAQRVDGFRVIVGDWLDNALPDGAFDRAYAIESSEHMADKARFFAEAARVLRPGGRLVVCAWLEGEGARPWEVRHLLRPICREGRMPSLGSRADYAALAEAAGLSPGGYEDISRKVRRTWSICLRRFAGRFFTDAEIRRLALSRATRSRDFVLSLPRLILALRTGAMRYGVFVWDKS